MIFSNRLKYILSYELEIFEIHFIEIDLVTDSLSVIGMQTKSIRREDGFK